LLVFSRAEEVISWRYCVDRLSDGRSIVEHVKGR
jgi:hypothetical protein